MRCYICDYTDGVNAVHTKDYQQSLYHRGIKTLWQANRKIILDKHTGLPICNVCFSVISADLATKDLEEEKQA